jgi:hypothetical protein
MKLIILFLFITGCGLDPSGSENVTPPAGPAPRPVPKAPSWTLVEPVVKEQCALSGCHAGAAFVQSGAAFKASAAKKRIESGNMPKQSSPNYPLYNTSKRDLMLAYLNG